MTDDPQVILLESGEKVDGPMRLADLMRKYEAPFGTNDEEYAELLESLKDEGFHEYGGLTSPPMIIMTFEVWELTNEADSSR